MTLVEASRPPNPTSITATSTPRAARPAKAMAVVASKKLASSRPMWGRRHVVHAAQAPPRGRRPSARGSTLYGSLVARRESGRRPRRTTGSVGSLRRLPAGHVTEQLGRRVPQLTARHHGVDHPMLEQELGRLETGRQVLADGLLD